MADKQPENLFEQVARQCLRKAKVMLEEETTPTAATVEMVEKLVDIAIKTDTLNLRWAEQSRGGLWAYSGPASLNPKGEN